MLAWLQPLAAAVVGGRQACDFLHVAREELDGGEAHLVGDIDPGAAAVQRYALLAIHKVNAPTNATPSTFIVSPPRKSPPLSPGSLRHFYGSITVVLR